MINSKKLLLKFWKVGSPGKGPAFAKGCLASSSCGREHHKARVKSHAKGLLSPDPSQHSFLWFFPSIQRMSAYEFRKYVSHT